MGLAMGRVKSAISERKAANLSKRDGMHAVGDPPGLYLYVAGAGRSWILRYTSPTGRRRDFGLGSYSDYTLAEAREKARAARKQALEGVDPIDEKRAGRDVLRAADAKRMTFSACVNAYIGAHGDGWRNPKHRQQWENTLETYAGPKIGNLDVALVDTPHLLKVLEPIWKEKTETATRLRGRIESVLSWATVRGYRSGDNPARWKGHLSELLANPSKVSKVEHLPALPYGEIGAFMVELRKQEGIGAAAVEFAILTAARSGEVRGATWDEIDFAGKAWKIPGERMKAGREHVVPLSDAAIAVLRKMEKQKTSNYVFPGAKEDKPLSDMSLTAVLRRMKRDEITTHGFRSTFRDWAAELTAYPSEMAEMALAHRISDKVEAAYRRGNLFAKRVRMMNDWARYCATVAKAANVLPLRKKKVTAPSG
jgi:integrase